MKRAYLWGWAILLALLFVVFFLWAMRPNYYLYYYRHHDLGFDNHLLSDAIRQLLAYMKGNVSSIQVGHFFNQREMAHMVDVRALYQQVRMFYWFCLALIVLLPLTLKRHQFNLLVKGLQQACYSFLIFIGMIGTWAITEFDGFWTFFHQLFFRNQLWLLTPGQDHMIDMLPADLFTDLVLLIGLTCLVLVLVLVLALRWVSKKWC